jgi:hypothetical protein
MKRYPTTATNAFATNAVLDTGIGKLLTVSCHSKNAATCYLQIFDAAALPSNSAIPLIEIPIATATTGTLDYGATGLPYAIGLVAALSTTAASLTIATSADGLFCGVTDYNQ